MKLKYGPYSSSKLDVATCGYWFQKRYIEKNRKDSLKSADRGAAVHYVFEKITEKFRENKNALFDDGVIRYWVAEALEKYPGAYGESSEILKMCKLYINKPIYDLTSDAGIELNLAVEMVSKGENKLEFIETDYNNPKAFFRGKIDVFVLADDLKSATIYDHKTQPNIEDADTFQMGVYAWLTWRHHPYLERIYSVLHFARYGYYSYKYEWSREDLLAIENEILTKVSFCENRTDFTPTPFKNCQYCPFLSECPTLSDLVEVDEQGNVFVKSNNIECFADTNKAVRLAGSVHVMSELVNKAKKNLQVHIKEFGPIAISGKVVGYKKSTSVDWSKVNKTLRGKVYSVLEKHGIDPKIYMSFNQSTTPDVFKIENLALQQDLQEILPLSSSTTFGYHSNLGEV